MIERSDCKDKKFEKVSQRKKRKPYLKPQLTEFGHIEKLTQGPTGHGNDGLAMKRT
jgi:hypothetical protein